MKPKNVEYRKSILGKYEVTYDCPGCGESLKNDLDDAGKSDQCPHCECEFVVPGINYKDEIERRRAERIAEKQKETERREAERREAERITREAHEKANREAELAAKEERIKASFRSKSDDKTSIQYISEGMAELVRALFHSVLSGIFGTITTVCVSFALSRPIGSNEGFVAFGMVSGLITAGFLLSFFFAITNSIDSFRKGSRS